VGTHTYREREREAVNNESYTKKSYTTTGYYGRIQLSNRTIVRNLTVSAIVN
jgi:hypothetical protein